MTRAESPSAVGVRPEPMMMGATAALFEVLRAGVKALSPASFALVMATGIVSIAVDGAGMRLLAVVLFGLNVIAYVVLWVLTILRIIWYAPEFLSDLQDHRRSVGFFATAAGTCVLGSQCILVSGQYLPATLLWALGIFLWIVSTYCIFTILIVKEDKPSLAEGISGSWLLAVVAWLLAFVGLARRIVTDLHRALSPSSEVRASGSG